MKDVITQEIVVKADQVVVFSAITEPEQIVKWFPSAIEGSLEAGDSPILNFGEHGKNQILVVDKKPHEYFSYRWVPGANHFVGDVSSVPNTLVEFFLETTDEGVKVTVKESGFAALPEELAAPAFEQNSGGWEFMINRLGKVVNKA